MNFFTQRFFRRKTWRYVFAFSIVFACMSFIKASAYDLVVAKDGSGNYTTVQAAIDAAPTGLTSPFVIYIKNGKYKEKITVPSNKPFIQLQGESVANVILTYDDYAGRMLTCNTTVGTQNSASFTINANDFSAINITFVNSFGDGSQAVAVLVNADRAAFKNCRFLGNQDTLYTKGGSPGKCYFYNCYIDGNIDFIFGSSIGVFDSCVVYAKSRTSAGNSYITAPNTPNGQAYGYVFRNARFPANTGATSYFLSRPWPSPSVAATAQKTVLLNSRITPSINPAGWSIWDANTQTSNLYYGEYNSLYFNGIAADVSQRVPWSFQLNASEAATYTNTNMLGAWDPCGVASGFCTPTQTDIAISNFRGVKGASSSQFDWNISWPITGIDYTLYRSTDNVTYSSVYTTTAANDTAVNFNYTDATVPPSGSIYYYYLAASKAGYATHITDTIQISSAPAITVNASDALNLCGFSQALGTPSAPQTYTISASNLTSNLTITPPANFEVSLNQSAWFTNASPLSIAPSSGSVATTTIYVRLNASAVGFYSGNVVNTSAGANTINVAVSGNTAAAPTSFLLQAWSMTQGANDSVEVRSAGVTANAATLKNLFTSDGTTPAGNVRPAYSGTYGQALGANAAGNNWQNVGGTLKRAYYEEFKVTASSGYSLRLDSIVVFSDFYQTTSNTKMAIVYSKTGFTTNDSTEITNGIGPTGAGLTFAVSNNFNKSFALLQNDGGAVSRYGLALNDVTGVTINAGQTLTIRVYWACGSSGTPRFAYLKNVQIKGIANNVLPLNLISFNGEKLSVGAKLFWQTVNETATNNFEVEKSLNGRSFESIGNVIAKNSISNQYDFVDNAFSATAYYRLRIVDNDGKEKWSNVVRLDRKASATISIYPNPVKETININHGKAENNGLVEIYSAMGERVKLIAVPKGSMQTNIVASDLAAGTYLVKYSDDKKTASQVVVKQ